MNQLLAQAFSGSLDLIYSATRIVQLLIPTTAAIALLYFFWGMANFIRKSGDEDGRAEGIETMKWGIISLFVIVSIWGIVVFIQSALGIEGGPSTIPNFYINNRN